MIRRWTLAVAFVVFTFPAWAKAASPVGQWLIEDGTGVIDIAACGTGLCGRIVGMNSVTADGSAPKDYRGRSECGLEIMHEMLPGAGGEWTGDITNPENGNVYGARLTLDEQGRLHLRGFLRVPLLGAALGSTQVWTGYAGKVTADCRMEP